MKTINSKLQKAGAETLAVLTVLFVTCFSLSAQGEQYESRYSQDEELALFESGRKEVIHSVKNDVAADLVYFAEFLEKENEAELAVENWMTEAMNFGAVALETVYEEVLNLEDWMLNDSLFTTTEAKTTTDEPVAVNAPRKKQVIGMVIPGAQFGRRTLILIDMDDPKLELENWMFDNKIWNKRN